MYTTANHWAMVKAISQILQYWILQKQVTSIFFKWEFAQDTHKSNRNCIFNISYIFWLSSSLHYVFLLSFCSFWPDGVCFNRYYAFSLWRHRFQKKSTVMEHWWHTHCSALSLPIIVEALTLLLHTVFLSLTQKNCSILSVLSLNSVFCFFIY